MRNVHVMDTTLRDGSHALAHAFTTEQVRQIAAALAGAGCEYLEVAHGDGLLGSSFQYGFSKVDELELIEAAHQAAFAVDGGKMMIGALLIPGIGTVERLEQAVERGVRFVRVATHVTEADVGAQHIAAAKKMGLMAVGFLMMTHMGSAETILEQARKFQDYGADVAYCADSAGAMIPEQVAERVSLLSSKLSIPVGFHAHNNLGLAVANSVAAVKAGACYIDATLRGLGAGAGNAPHELLAAVFEKYGIAGAGRLYPLMDAAEACVGPLPAKPQIDAHALTIGYAGVYGSFLLHARRAAEKYGVDARDVLLELGRLKTVGGQEDMILDVAYRLSQHKA